MKGGDLSCDFVVVVAAVCASIVVAITFVALVVAGAMGLVVLG